jgi:hypothetical protein
MTGSMPRTSSTTATNSEIQGSREIGPRAIWVLDACRLGCGEKCARNASCSAEISDADLVRLQNASNEQLKSAEVDEIPAISAGPRSRVPIS